MAGREAHWWNPSYYFVIIHLSLRTHWFYGLADPCCPPPPSWNDGIRFFDDGPLKKICLWTVEIRLLMFNCVLMCDYLSTWHFFPPSWAKWEQLKLIRTSFLGKRNCILSFTLIWEGQPRRRPQFKFDSTHASFGCFHCYFLCDERLYTTPASAPEKSMLPPSRIRTLTLKAPGFFSAPFPIAHASLKFSSLSSRNCLCANCVLFLPLLHAAHQGDEQFRGVRVWWSWP